MYEAWIHWTIGGATVAGGLILPDPWRVSSDQQRLLYDVLQLSLLAGVHHRSALWLDDVFNTHEESCICAIQPVSQFLLHSPCLGTVWQDASTQALKKETLVEVEMPDCQTVRSLLQAFQARPFLARESEKKERKSFLTRRRIEYPSYFLQCASKQRLQVSAENTIEVR